MVDFVTVGQSRACCLSLLSVLVLTYAKLTDYKLAWLTLMRHSCAPRIVLFHELGSLSNFGVIRCFMLERGTNLDAKRCCCILFLSWNMLTAALRCEVFNFGLSGLSLFSVVERKKQCNARVSASYDANLATQVAKISPLSMFLFFRFKRVFTWIFPILKKKFIW